MNMQKGLLVITLCVNILSAHTPSPQDKAAAKEIMRTFKPLIEKYKREIDVATCEFKRLQQDKDFEKKIDTYMKKNPNVVVGTFISIISDKAPENFLRCWKKADTPEAKDICLQDAIRQNYAAYVMATKIQEAEELSKSKTKSDTFVIRDLEIMLQNPDFRVPFALVLTLASVADQEAELCKKS